SEALGLRTNSSLDRSRLYGAALADGKAKWFWSQGPGKSHLASRHRQQQQMSIRSPRRNLRGDRTAIPRKSNVVREAATAPLPYEEDAITCSGCAEPFNAIVMT